MDNKGWSLRFMLFLTSLLILALLIGSFFIVKLSKSFSNEIKSTSTSDYNDKINDSNNYQKIENYMDKISLDYIEKEYNNDIGMAITTIHLDRLIKYDSTQELFELTKGKNCVGYSNVFEESNKINVSSYLKCDKYQSDGFSKVYLN